MKGIRERSADRTTRTERSDVGFYLPGTYRASNEPGRIERILTSLFRRRGVLPADFWRASETDADRRRTGD
ncbi:hypothetical protein BRC86_07395 [Halobacteriales archaeon QS_3_64_16]|nr:MAG: hypothetical protein BRC86_07395 [Halobacteriales archaeon QS_3_64_16]